MQIPDVITYDFLGGDRVDRYPLSNPTTDFSSEQLNTALCGVSMMSRTAVKARAVVSIQAVPVLSSYESVWKAKTPSLPVVSRIGTGQISLTFPVSVLDERSVSHDLNLKFGNANIVSNGVGIITVSVSANVVTVSSYSLAGSLSDLSNVVVCVEVS